jgi:hypothetical protein
MAIEAAAQRERRRRIERERWRRNERGSRERGGGATREAREREVAAQRERRRHDKIGDDATTNRWRESGAMRQALAWR